MKVSERQLSVASGEIWIPVFTACCSWKAQYPLVFPEKKRPWLVKCFVNSLVLEYNSAGPPEIRPLSWPMQKK